MTREDIIRMAREAGINPCLRGHPDHPERDNNGNIAFWAGVNQNTLERFAALVAAAEREACAKVCDELHWPWRMGDNSGPKECAAAIRAMGQA